MILCVIFCFGERKLNIFRKIGSLLHQYKVFVSLNKVNLLSLLIMKYGLELRGLYLGWFKNWLNVCNSHVDIIYNFNVGFGKVRLTFHMVLKI